MTLKLDESVQTLRDAVNGTRRIQTRLLSESRWNEFCSALDTAGDTHNALSAFLRLDTDDLGVAYLSVYGALQALVVQQDAVRSIVEVSGLEFPRGHARLDEIRNARVLSVGHPTNARQGKKSSFIIQTSMNSGQFELFTLLRDGGFEKETVVADEMIRDQQTILSQQVERTRKHLVDQDRAHRAKYRDRKLAEALSSVRTYLQATTALIHAEDGAMARDRAIVCEIPMFENALKQIESDLEERGELAAHDDTVVPQLKLIHHCIDRLRGYFEAGAGEGSTRLDAEAFGLALHASFDDLHEFLKGLDKQYEAG